jgi:2-methylaconitate cis-trans-isomerase PrpF
MEMKKYPCVYMRGGTSKAVIFHKEDLPTDQKRTGSALFKGYGDS